MANSATFTPKFTPAFDPREETVPLAAWAASTAYRVGQIVRSGNGSGDFYQCQVAGTSGSSAPTWTTTGATVTDNTVTWLDIGAGNPGDMVLRPNGSVGFIAGTAPLTIERTVTFNYFSVGYVPKASATVFADGQDVFFNTSTNLAVTAVPSQGFFLGTSRGGTVSGATQVLVCLNAGDTSAMPPFAIIAAAGSGQSTATLIGTQRAYVTGANGAKGVKLPLPSPDMGVVVVNEANALLFIYGNGTETIDSIAGATGINVPGICTIMLRSDGTNWYSQRGELTNGQTTIDTGAPTGTTSANAYQIFGSIYFPAQANINGTVGALLPAPAAGLQLAIINDSASQALKIYSATGNINGTVGTTAYSLAAGKVGFAISDGNNWRVMISA
jgi:hypothetical protein